MKKKSFLINYLGKKGAGPLLTYEFVKEFSRQNSDIQIFVILSSRIENKQKFKSIFNVKTIFIPTYSNSLSFIINSLFILPIIILFLKIKFLSFYFTLIYVPMVSPWSFFINKLSLSYKKLIVSLHDPEPHLGENQKLLNFLINLEFYNSDHLIIFSNQFIKLVSSKFKKNLGNIHVFKLPDTEYYRVYNNSKILNELIYDNKKMNLLFFGRFTEYKGLDILASAYRKLISIYPLEFTLTVAGSGDFSPYIGSFQNLEPFSLINRWISENDIGNLFTHRKLIVIVPYVDASQSGIIQISNSFNVPVISSNISGLLEQIIDGQTGLFFKNKDSDDLIDKIVRLSTDSNLYDSIKRNLELTKDDRSWKNYINKFNEIFLEG